jgi:DNA repair protein RecO (recombination protein O)
MVADGQSIGLYRAQGIVLRGIRLGEADRIVTIYTQSHGKLRGVAKGVRKSRSRFGGRLDAFTHVDLLLYKGRSDLDIITQADIITRPRRIRNDYPSFCAASAIADAVDRTTPDRERNVRVFLLLRSAVQALEDGAEDAALLAYAFLAKLTSIGGLHPTLATCVECGAPDRVAFSHARGGAVCASCLDRVDPKADDAVLDTWTALLADEWNDLRSRRLPVATQRTLAGLLLAFVQWHTDSRFRAFGLLPSLASSRDG